MRYIALLFIVFGSALLFTFWWAPGFVLLLGGATFMFSPYLPAPIAEYGDVVLLLTVALTLFLIVVLLVLLPRYV